MDEPEKSAVPPNSVWGGAIVWKGVPVLNPLHATPHRISPLVPPLAIAGGLRLGALAPKGQAYGARVTSYMPNHVRAAPGQGLTVKCMKMLFESATI